MVIQERTAQRRGDKNAVKASTDLRDLAKNALTPIEKKLKGIYTPGSPTATAHARERASAVREKEVTTSNLVQMLIQEATDPVNLVSEHKLNTRLSLRSGRNSRQRCTWDGALTSDNGLAREWGCTREL